MNIRILKIFLIPILCLPGCSAFASQPTLPKAPFVLPQTLKSWMQSERKVTVVDVREPKEYKAGHIDGAINIPYRDVEGRSEEFRQPKDFVFYCVHSSWRAPYAANTLADHGLKNVYVLEGGISAWNAGGQVIYPSTAGQPGIVAPYAVSMADTIELRHPPDRKYDGSGEMTLEELAHYDGQDGRPAYVAVNGVIYDLTQSRLWRGGVHDPSEGRAMAGRDLSELIKESPHGVKTLEAFPVVGRLVDSKLP